MDLRLSQAFKINYLVIFEVISEAKIKKINGTIQQRDCIQIRANNILEQQNNVENIG